MKEVTIKTSELLEKVRANRDNHRAIFDQAIVVYRERAVDELERMLDDTKNGRKIERAIGLVQPVDYTKEYDRAILMLEMTVEEELKIDSRDFSRFVMDDWEWMENFTNTTAAYLVSG